MPPWPKIRPICHRLAPILIILPILNVSAAAHPAEASAGRVSLEEAVQTYRSGAPLHALDVFVVLARAKPQSALPVIWAGIAATAAGQIQAAGVYFHEGLNRPHSALQDRITWAWLQRLKSLPNEPILRPSEAIIALAHASDPTLTWVRAAWIGNHVVTAAGREGLDPYLLAAVVYIESGFNQAATSHAGALGLGQLMPHTAQAAGVDPRDPWGNLMGSALTLRGSFLEFGDWPRALAAYNAGPGAVRRYRGIPPYAETRSYVRAVLGTYHKIRRKG